MRLNRLARVPEHVHLVERHRSHRKCTSQSNSCGILRFGCAILDGQIKITANGLNKHGLDL